jgi:hypothetical protein
MNAEVWSRTDVADWRDQISEAGIAAPENAVQG